MTELTQEKLKSLFIYDSSTGIFTRSIRMGNKQPGSAANSLSSHGYVRIMVEGVRYLAHRLAWLYEYGALPSKFIDHINNNPADNRIANLREATMAENKRNTRRQRNNTSGHKGVSRRGSNGKWMAYVKHEGRLIHAGDFVELHEAVAARQRLAKTLHGEFYGDKV